MNLDFNILVFLTGFIFSLPIIGYLFRFHIPISIFFLLAGTFMVAIFLATDNIVLGYEQVTDSSQISESSIGNTTTLVYVVDSTVGSDLTMFNSTGGTKGRGEMAVTGSVLIGQDIQCISIDMKKVGIGAGNIRAGFWAVGSGTPFLVISSISSSIVTASFETYEFCLPEGSEVRVTANTIFAIEVSSGNSTNNITVKRDSTNPFDGTFTQRVTLAFGGGAWAGVSGEDSTMRAYDLIPITIVTEDFIQSVEPNLMDISFTGENFQLKVIMIFISIMFIVGGALVEVRQR